MTYTILASVCQHPIRRSSHLPWSGSPLDFDVRYCTSCSASRSTRTGHEDAGREYHRSRTLHDAGALSRSTYRETRRRYDNARVSATEDREYWEERDERERRSQGRPTLREGSRRFAGLDDPEWLAFKQAVHGSGRGRGVRVAESESHGHRRESQYREQPLYRRSSQRYEPGRYGDRSGQGYYDTSNTNRRSRDEDLHALSDEDLDDRRVRVSRALSRFR